MKITLQALLPGITINLLLISLYKEHVFIFQMKENVSLSP